MKLFDVQPGSSPLKKVFIETSISNRKWELRGTSRATPVTLQELLLAPGPGSRASGPAGLRSRSILAARDWERTTESGSFRAVAGSPFDQGKGEDVEEMTARRAKTSVSLRPISLYLRTHVPERAAELGHGLGLRDTCPGWFWPGRRAFRADGSCESPLFDQSAVIR